jgi:hypothetical protein
VSESSRGAGCLIAFATPFAAVGIYCGVAAYRVATLGESKIAFVLGCAAVAFGGAGFGIMAMAIRGRRRGLGGDASRAAHPDEPWMANGEWASRRIRDHSGAGTLMLWGFALLWNAIAAPVLVFLPEEVQKGNQLAWIGLLFPLVGVGLLMVAVRATLRLVRFRNSTLVLDTLPAPIGGTLRGTVEVPHPLTNVTAVMLRLNAVTRVRTRNETSETAFCHDEREVDPASLRQTPEGTAIPVEMPIPDDASATDADRTWQLVVDAEVPGIDYSATFDVPVFRTAFADFRPHGVPAPLGPPRTPRSFVERDTAEGRELRFPPFRARALAFWSLLCALFAIAATFFSVAIGAPRFLTALFALVTIPIALSTLDLFFASRSVVLAPDRILARRRLLFSSETAIPYADVTSVATVIAANNGARPYYHVDVRTKDGKRRRVAKYIASKREAEWAASRIRR